MATKLKTIKSYRTQIVAAMKELETYKEEYNSIIEILAKMLFDYEKVVAEFEESGGELVIQHTNKAGATNVVKNPYYVAIEGLRDDILVYCRELGLTPNGLNKLNVKTENQQKSKLSEALELFGK